MAASKRELLCLQFGLWRFLERMSQVTSSVTSPASPSTLFYRRVHIRNNYNVILIFSRLSFLPLRQEHPSFPDDRTSSAQWPARKSLLDPPAEVTPKMDDATPTAPEQGSIALQPLQAQPAEKETLLSPSSVALERLVPIDYINRMATRKRNTKPSACQETNRCQETCITV